MPFHSNLVFEDLDSYRLLRTYIDPHGLKWNQMDSVGHKDVSGIFKRGSILTSTPIVCIGHSPSSQSGPER